MRTEFNIECIGQDGNRRSFSGFLISEADNTKFKLILTEGDLPIVDYPVDFQLIVLNDNEIRVTDMYIDQTEYRALGIPDALIIKAREILNKTIVSSTRFQDNNEHLHEPAVKVWKRLVSNSLAYYDEDTGRYKTVNQKSTYEA